MYKRQVLNNVTFDSFSSKKYYYKSYYRAHYESDYEDFDLPKESEKKVRNTVSASGTAKKAR